MPETGSYSSAAQGLAADARATCEIPRAQNVLPTQSARCWTSAELLGEQAEARIRHAGAVYRLRVTALGKLILTK